MSEPAFDNTAVGEIPRRLFHRNFSFLIDKRLGRILELAGHSLHFGRPGRDDAGLVWGRSPTSRRGEKAAIRAGVPLIRVEDAFLRSLRPGRMGDAPIGLLLDDMGVHFDSAAPSRLEQILASHPLDDSYIISRSRAGIGRLQWAHLSKYNIHDLSLPVPPEGYVLVVDQTRNDASIRHSGATAASFAAMLIRARQDHPGERIVIKAHPETVAGLRPGHFSQSDTSESVSLLTTPVSPWTLLAGARAVYTVSSQLGFEAILAGHMPVVFGQPFYAGWGLTQDELPMPRRIRRLNKVQLFAAAMILAPLWYDPCRDRLCSFEEAVDQLEAEVRSFRQDHQGHVAFGMRLWKRKRLQQVFGRHKALIFHNNPVRAKMVAKEKSRSLLIWAGKEPEGFTAPALIFRVEDGFLRSRGLGANLTPPLSLVTDDMGIYYDPSRPSQLEEMILAAPPPGGRQRADRLTARIIALGLSKYNFGRGDLPNLPEGHRILVPGQVEDDASIIKGAGQVRSNRALLIATRAENPDAVILYKPHPDVEAGLRPGAISDREMAGLADLVLLVTDPVAILPRVNEVWTMTSLLGFEALLRGLPVTCLGAPFYAGWGLTRDLGPVPGRRLRRDDGSPLPRPDLMQLIHATLISYPRYFDPVSGLACPPEVIVERLVQDGLPEGPANRLLSRLQGRFASWHRLWR